MTTPGGNLLWDPSGFIDDVAVAAVRAAGGLSYVTASHPHFYGHFPDSAVVHWASGADGRGALLSGDTIFVAPGEDRVTFVWSAPNLARYL